MKYQKDKIDKQLNAMIERKYSIAKSNELIQKTATVLTLNEQKFILIALSKIKKDDDVFKTYCISIYDFCEILNIEKTEGGYLYQRMFKYLKKIADNSIWFYDSNDKATKLIRWFSNIEIRKGVIYYNFDSSIQEYIFNLKKYYTTFELWNVLLLNSKNSIEFYEFMKSLNNLKIAPIFEVDVLQKKFNVNYKTYSEFKRSFLKKCIAEINEKTDLYVEFNEIKNLRKVEKLEFIIKNIENKDLMNRYIETESKIQMKQLDSKKS